MSEAASIGQRWGPVNRGGICGQRLPPKLAKTGSLSRKGIAPNKAVQATVTAWIVYDASVSSKEIIYFQPKKMENLLLKKLSADADKVEIFNYLPSYDLFLFTHILITKVLGHVTL